MWIFLPIKFKFHITFCKGYRAFTIQIYHYELVNMCFAIVSGNYDNYLSFLMISQSMTISSIGFDHDELSTMMLC